MVCWDYIVDFLGVCVDKLLFSGVSGAAFGKACEVTSLYPDLGVLKGAQQGNLPILYLL